MMRTKVTYTLVALAAVAAANPLPKHGSASAAALEDNATCELLVFTEEPQCALAIGVDPNEVEESSGLERRADMGDDLHKFEERLNKTKESCTRDFPDMCSPNSDMSQPVPGTDIIIDKSPSIFFISFMNDLSHNYQWADKIRELHRTENWAKTGYDGLGFKKDMAEAFFFCLGQYCDFHLAARILASEMRLSIEQKGDLLWLFDVPQRETPEAPQNLDYHRDMSQPVPGTDIIISESPSMFVISFMNDLSHKDQWADKIKKLHRSRNWGKTGYNGLGFKEDMAEAFLFCFSQYRNFHSVAHILVLEMRLSIKQKDDLSWYFDVPQWETPEAPQNLDYHRDMSQPVPGTDIIISESPSMFVISFMNDLSHKDQWADEIRRLYGTIYWGKTGYNWLGFKEDMAEAFLFCFSQYCNFHSVALILTSRMRLSIKDDFSWHFDVPPRETPEAPQNPEVDSAPNDDGIWGNEGVSDNKGAPSNEGAPNNESDQVIEGMEKWHV